jgi:hypothetical protein
VESGLRRLACFLIRSVQSGVGINGCSALRLSILGMSMHVLDHRSDVAARRKRFPVGNGPLHLPFRLRFPPSQDRRSDLERHRTMQPPHHGAEPAGNEAPRSKGTGQSPSSPTPHRDNAESVRTREVSHGLRKREHRSVHRRMRQSGHQQTPPGWSLYPPAPTPRCPISRCDQLARQMAGPRRASASTDNDVSTI